MSYAEKSLEQFTDLLASSAPAPGGGGACALCGALAAALGSMVGQLTVGKARYAQNESALHALGERAEKLRIELLEMIDGDEAAFAPLSQAYALPKDTPGREETLERCLLSAAASPMRIAELCCEAVELCEGYAALGSRLVLSDAATGAALASGALRGAVINIKVNTALMRDRSAAAALDARADALEKEYAARSDAVCVAVAAALGFS